MASCISFQGVDEDSSELVLASAARAGNLPSVQIVSGGSDEQNICPASDQVGLGGPGLNPSTITKARSEMDLKSPREESVRHFRRPPRKLLDLPRYSPPPPARIRDADPRPESPLEEAESQDQVCRLVAPILLTTTGLHHHHHHQNTRPSPDIEFPPTLAAKTYYSV